MDLTVATLRIVFFAAPGLWGMLVYRKLRGSRTRARSEELGEILFFSVGAYLAAAGVGATLLAFAEMRGAGDIIDSSAIASARTLEGLFSDEAVPVWGDIVWATCAATALACAAAFIHTNSLHMRVARTLKITRRLGDEDIWEFYWNSPDTDGWIYVRDHVTDRCYLGQVAQFSDSGASRELAMAYVTVYNNQTGIKLYSLESLYISRASDQLTIERPPHQGLKKRSRRWCRKIRLMRRVIARSMKGSRSGAARNQFFKHLHHRRHRPRTNRPIRRRSS